MQPVVCYVVRRDSSAIKLDRVEIAFIRALFFGEGGEGAETTNRRRRGRKLEYPEKTADDELQKMPHIKTLKFKPQPRLEPAH